MTTINHKTEELVERGVSYLEDVARTIRDDALTLVRQKFAAPQRDLDLESLLNRRDFVEYFKHGVASGIAGVLAAHDQRVQAVYIYDPSANPDSELGVALPVDATVYLLVRVSTPSAALESFIASLDRALAESMKELPSPLYEQRESILDTCVVSEIDVQQRRGYGAMLSSLFAPPLRVWQREVVP
jgi:hypothetical protein